MTHTKSIRRKLTGMLRYTFGASVLLSALVPACLNREIDTIEPRNTFSFQEKLPQKKVDKIDILLAIDNSGSMGDKQEVLAVAVPDLVNSLVNPPCIDPTSGQPTTVDGPLAPCPDGMHREFEPVIDIHIGVISTSLGARNGTACVEVPGKQNDDNAQLLDRLSPTETLATFQDKGFLAWDPAAADPATGSYQNAAELNVDFAGLVEGVGQDGCGLEAQMESWYRFLVDPNPYETVGQDADGNATLEGTDQDLLAQREAFLRPDSMVAIVMLTDENDCSFKPNRIGYYTGHYNKLMGVKARQECADNPNDPCCTYCGSPALPETCPADPTCDDPQPLDVQQSNLTCMQQKRRFGFDLLYKTQRYIDGLTKTRIMNRDNEEVDNPLFVAPNGQRRAEDLVFFAGIVGVPWQLIARDQNDLTKGFKSASELAAPVNGQSTWDMILGDPANNVPPSSPYMVESIYPRSGLAPMSGGYNADPIHGHEYEVDLNVGIGDVQYACIFELPDPLDCSGGACDCGPSSYKTNDPLCQAPDGSYGTTQYRAKAYPGLRQLEVLKGIGDQGIVGSICPAQLEDGQQNAKDYGYRPAIEALIERLKQELTPPCLPRPLVPDTQQQVSCLLLEGRSLQDGESCTCDHAEARIKVAPEHAAAGEEMLASAQAEAFDLDCVCEIEQVSGEALNACQSDTSVTPEVGGEPIHGWCYVDEQVAAEELVAHCSADKQTIRFVGEGNPVNDSLLFLSCHESNNE